MSSDTEYLSILNEGTAAKQYALATSLEAQGTPETLCRAALLMIRSAESGFEPAKAVFFFDFNRKGHMHVNKNRFKLIECAAKDYSKAFSWFSEAAENGHLAASYYLGKMYFKGRAPKPTRSKDWVTSSMPLRSDIRKPSTTWARCMNRDATSPRIRSKHSPGT